MEGAASWPVLRLYAPEPEKYSGQHPKARLSDRPSSFLQHRTRSLIKSLIGGSALPGPAGNNSGKDFEKYLEVLWQEDIPLVLDADGLRWLARVQPPVRNTPFATPHPGEAHASRRDDRGKRFFRLGALKARYGGTYRCWRGHAYRRRNVNPMPVCRRAAGQPAREMCWPVLLAGCGRNTPKWRLIKLPRRAFTYTPMPRASPLKRATGTRLLPAICWTRLDPPFGTHVISLPDMTKNGRLGERIS